MSHSDVRKTSRKRKHQQSLKFSTTVDFLPDELLIEILSYLDVPEKCYAARVSKRWNKLVQTESLWRQMDLVHMNINLRKTWPSLQQYFMSTLTSLCIGYPHYNHNHTMLTYQIMMDIGEVCVKLTSLSLNGLNLVEVHSDSLPNSLVTLTIQKCYISRHWLLAAAEAGNLHTLEVLKMKYVQYKHSYHMMLCSLEMWAFPNLQKFSLIISPGPWNKVNCCQEFSESLTKECPKLHTLELSYCRIGNKCMQLFSENFSNSLKHVHLKNCCAVSKAGVLYLKNVSSLETLHVVGCFDVDEKGEESMKGHFNGVDCKFISGP
ncbi:F-box/LRR-repeat protein 12-like [Amphiura filiformis]|uniref:F-box/LRR-repeat protein 12-like n=1 Tax=Amphiura filiformis TaxID=82378 RepID=UPI003B2232BB